MKNALNFKQMGEQKDRPPRLREEQFDLHPLSKSNKKNQKCMHAPEKTPRARKGCLQLSFLEGGPRQTPGLLGWAGRARARARAKYPAKFESYCIYSLEIDQKPSKTQKKKNH